MCEILQNSFSLTPVESRLWFHLESSKSTMKGLCVVQSLKFLKGQQTLVFRSSSGEITNERV